MGEEQVPLILEDTLVGACHWNSNKYFNALWLQQHSNMLADNETPKQPGFN